MFQSSEFDRINQEFMEKQKERKAKLSKIWGFFLGLTIFLILLFIFIFPNQFEDTAVAWILPVYGGIALLVTIIGLIVTANFLSAKPFFTTLFPRVIEKINMTEGLFLQYVPYIKEKQTFNKEGGLFTRYASINLRRKVSGETSDQYHFEIMDCTLTTSSGNSQQTHFDGSYFILRKTGQSIFQARSNGSPKLKGVKFDKIDAFENIKVYKEEEQPVTNLDHQYAQFVTRLLMNEKYKKVYLGLIHNEVHLAIWYKKHPLRKVKKLSTEALNDYYKSFMDELKIIEELSMVDNY